jgi:hypothetical protein
VILLGVYVSLGDGAPAGSAGVDGGQERNQGFVAIVRDDAGDLARRSVADENVRQVLGWNVRDAVGLIDLQDRAQVRGGVGRRQIVQGLTVLGQLFADVDQSVDLRAGRLGNLGDHHAPPYCGQPG